MCDSVAEGTGQRLSVGPSMSEVASDAGCVVQTHGRASQAPQIEQLKHLAVRIGVHTADGLGFNLFPQVEPWLFFLGVKPGLPVHVCRMWTGFLLWTKLNREVGLRMKDFLQDKLKTVEDLFDAGGTVQTAEDCRAVLSQIEHEASRQGHAEIVSLCQVKSEIVGVKAARRIIAACLAELPKEFLTAEDIAQMLQVSTRTVWRMRSANELPEPITIGKSVRWKASDIEKWIQKGGR